MSPGDIVNIDIHYKGRTIKVSGEVAESVLGSLFIGPFSLEDLEPWELTVTFAEPPHGFILAWKSADTTVSKEAFVKFPNTSVWFDTNGLPYEYGWLYEPEPYEP